jgi:hypothetical protein
VPAPTLRFLPLTPARWRDVGALFGPHGARIVEGYPTEPGSWRAPDVFVFIGLASSFEGAGFVEVARRSRSRPLMRRQVR